MNLLRKIKMKFQSAFCPGIKFINIIFCAIILVSLLYICDIKLSIYDENSYMPVMIRTKLVDGNIYSRNDISKSSVKNISDLSVNLVAHEAPQQSTHESIQTDTEKTISSSLPTTPIDEGGDDDDNFLIKTTGCRIRNMDVMSAEIRKFFKAKPPKPVDCGVPPLVVSDESFLWINLTNSELKLFYNVSQNKINCSYVSFVRLSDKKIKENKTINSLPFGERAKIDTEFVRVFCSNQKGEEIFNDHHAFFPRKANPSQEIDRENKYNIMILGVDSVSRLNFHRMMKKTSKFLMEDLEAIELLGYNKVGDNTYPNLIPFLTGLSAGELAEICLSPDPKDSFFDDCNIIWNEFKKKGYNTLYAEDAATLSLFNYLKKGFDEQPTDFYSHTITREMEKSTSDKRYYKLCLGHRNVLDVFLNGYLRKFVKSKFDELFFSFLWTAAMTHDEIDTPLLVDDDFKNLLTFLKDENYLNNTILFFMSDHGIRFGTFRSKTYQGMIEERLPFMFTVFPSSFNQKYEFAMTNFKKNSRRLTTHYDVYETLQDLANLDEDSLSIANLQKRAKKLAKNDLPRGISLFLEIPEDRTCDSAGIDSHWCTCFEKEKVAVEDERVQRAAKFVVKRINAIIKPFEACKKVHLDEVLVAHMHVLNENLFKMPIDSKKKSTYEISLKISTTPDENSEYEATVKFDDFTGEKTISGDISRVTSYSTGCVQDSFVEKYCYCK